MALRSEAATTLISTGSVWRYLDNGSNQGTNWISRTFDDSGWASGPGQLGYGDGDEATVVGFGPNSSSRYITTYFRRSFVVGNPALYPNLRIGVMRDDGVAVYLNGTEIYRNSLPAGAGYNTLASATIGGADESAFYSNAVPAGLLVAGTNVVAVEIHQAAANSSDISFDLWLIDTTTNFAPVVTITQPTNNAAITPPVTIDITAIDANDTVTNVTLWAGTNPFGSVSSNGAGSFTLVWSNMPPGYYTLRAVATDTFGWGSTSTPVNVMLLDPVIRLTSPTNGATGIAPTNLVLTALVTDTNVALDRLDFYAGSSWLGSVTSEPWELTWTNAPVGTWALTVVAVQTNGLSNTSAPVAITLNANQPPSAALTSPTNNAAFGFGTTVSLSATATDSDGVVTNVAFTVNGGSLSSDVVPPFTAAWSNALPGIYTLRAIATDERGLSATSAPVTVTIARLPTTLIATGSVWKYLDNGSNQGTNWTLVSFNDSAWASGPAQLGYGDSSDGRPEATVLTSNIFTPPSRGLFDDPRQNVS